MIYSNANDRARDIEKMVAKQPNYKIATVTAVTSGVPTIRFWGESTASSKTYGRLSSYTAAVNDKVLLIKVGGTFVILGKIV